MRIRTIKPEFFTHDGLFELEQQTQLPIRVAYIGLWCASDREGRFKWEPRRLGAQILPYDGIDFSRVLDALATRGFVVRYASPGSKDACFGWIPSFTRHQVINNRERSSEFPNPPDNNDIDACPTRAPHVNDACPTPLNLDQAEGKGKEGNGTSTSEDTGVRHEGEPAPDGFKQPACGGTSSGSSGGQGVRQGLTMVQALRSLYPDDPNAQQAAATLKGICK